jgi:N-acyl-phosphatidylethanolamine-hydrolysing phospholipase D
MIEIDDRTIWYSGDTGYNPYQFKEIAEKFPKIDLALISIGAYEPRWFMKDMHVNPEEAVQIHEDINSRYSLGIQWGTFQLTAEPIDDPPIKLKEALVKKGIPFNNFETMKIGETRGNL